MAKIAGFTLIEMIIVVAVIGILAAIMIPSYQAYQKTTSLKACLFEVKGYSNLVYVDLFDQNDATVPFSPTVNACASITDASSMDDLHITKITAVVKHYPSIKIECDLENNSNCKILE